MKKLIALAMVILAFCVSGCGLIPSSGLLITETRLPGVYHGDDNQSVMIATGEACLVNYLLLYAKGDASIAKAMENGNIKNVATVDHSINSYLILYARYCTIVTGD